MRQLHQLFRLTTQAARNSSSLFTTNIANNNLPVSKVSANNEEEDNILLTRSMLLHNNPFPRVSATQTKNKQADHCVSPVQSKAFEATSGYATFSGRQRSCAQYLIAHSCGSATFGTNVDG